MVGARNGLRKQTLRMGLCGPVSCMAMEMGEIWVDAEVLGYE
jgi:hypothetical protein